MLTRSGLGVLVVAILLAGCGWWWGYEELVVAAVAAIALVAIGAWSSRRRPRIAVTRRLATTRVARGDPVHAIYRVTNDSKHRSSPATLIDRLDLQPISIEVPSLASSSAATVHGALPTRRRGVFDVGPWEVERVDPFGLAIGRRVTYEVVPVLVHPKVYRLAGPYGAMQTVEAEAVMRRTASDPLAGFVSLRAYVDGDDPRLIHWPTTARTGTLMVREHVELRRPELTVVLDTSVDVSTPDDFEEEVDVAASIAIHALGTGLDVVVRTTSREHPGVSKPLVAEGQVLDLLTPVAQSSGASSIALGELFAGRLDRASVVVVTGPRGPSSRMPPSGRVIVARVGAGAEIGPGIALAVADAAEFSARWRPWV